jgi:hypothetical protein
MAGRIVNGPEGVENPGNTTVFAIAAGFQEAKNSSQFPAGRPVVPDYGHLSAKLAP